MWRCIEASLCQWGSCLCWWVWRMLWHLLHPLQWSPRDEFSLAYGPNLPNPWSWLTPQGSSWLSFCLVLSIKLLAVGLFACIIVYNSLILLSTKISIHFNNFQGKEFAFCSKWSVSYQAERWSPLSFGPSFFLGGTSAPVKQSWEPRTHLSCTVALSLSGHWWWWEVAVPAFFALLLHIWNFCPTSEIVE